MKLSTPPTPSFSRKISAAVIGALSPGARMSRPNRRNPGHASPPSGLTPQSPSIGQRLAFPIVALLAALAVGLLFLLPGGPLHAQDADGPIMYAENGTGPVATYTAEDPEGTAITWSLLDTDDGADDFDINNGVLTFKSSPDYEAAADGDTDNAYKVTVVATDSDNQTGMMAVTVMVTNVDEAGTLTLSTLQPVDGIEVTAALTDIDSVAIGNLLGTVMAGDIAWKWAKSPNRAGTYADIDGETAAKYTPVPADLNHYLRATVMYTDPEGSGKSEMAVSDRKVLSKRSTNTAPVFRNADNEGIADDEAITRDVLENSAAGRDIGDPVAAYDAQGDVLTYTISGGGEASFDIDRATGQIMVGAGTMLDFEAPRSYTVMVTATGPGHGDADGDADSDTITVNITVTNVDEDPELTGMESVRFAENTPTATAVGSTYTATDDEDASNGDVSLTLSGADAADFNITDGVLTFKESPNYEDPADAGTDNVYNITVVATDSDNQTDTMAVTVMVTNVDEVGTLTLSTVQPRVGTPLTATLTDIDGAVSDVVWKWERVTGDNLMDPGTIMGADSATYTPTGDDDENMFLRATATSYTDPQGSGQPEVTVVSANAVEKDDTNKAPEFPDQDMETEGEQTDQERTVEENTDAGMPIGSSAVTAMDPNGDDTLTYTLGGTDMASFGIHRGTGQLQTKAALDKEEKDTYMVTVTATDPSGLSATVNVTIKVTNFAEDPEITGGDITVRYAENRTGAVETYTATDDEDDKARTTVTWSLEGSDASDFEISSAGVLTFKETPNYEAAADDDTDNAYQVTVKATDSSDVSDTVEVTVNVTNVDEDGTLTLLNRQPVDGVELLTELTDIDSIMPGLSDLTIQTWKWEKSTSRTSGWTVIEGAAAEMYTPVPADVGSYLRATVDLHRPRGIRQVRDRRLGQEGAGDAEHEHRSRVQERRQ